MKGKIFLLIMMITLAGLTSMAQADLRKKVFNINSDGVALSGYDPVSYFTPNGPLKGKKAIASTWQGIGFYFSSEANRTEFNTNPTKYEPRYGGWCAYAMGNDGSKVEVDPETFKIIEGKLYLFYNKWFNNTLKSWNKNETALKKNADINWTKIFK